MLNFVIVGSFRSGTTLLSNIFNSHPESYCLYDPCIYFFKTYRNYIYNQYLKKKISLVDNNISDYIEKSDFNNLKWILKNNHFMDKMSNYYFKSLKQQLINNKFKQQPNLYDALKSIKSKSFLI